jgi:curli production assembly/transport component CsgF
VFSVRPYACFLVVALCTPAAADMVYKPFNPAFGGDSFNSTYLQSMATTQNQYKEKIGSSQQTNADRFISMLQSRLYSSLATQVADAIFGEHAQPSGTITLDNQTISFVNDGTQITLSVMDILTGQTTNIVIPVLQ